MKKFEDTKRQDYVSEPMIKSTRKKNDADKSASTPAESIRAEPIKVAPVKIEAPRPEPVKAQTVQAEIPRPTVARTEPSPKVSHVSLELVKPGAKTVCVAGSFNGWKPEKAPLVQKGNGRWVGDLTINPGRYEYLFVVDGQWVPDPNAKETVQNPFGGRNCVLTVSN